jgi:hypothetical protein
MSSLSTRKSLQLAQLKVWSMFIKSKAKLKVCARNRFAEEVIFVWLISSVANEQSPTNDRVQLGARIPGSRPPLNTYYICTSSFGGQTPPLLVFLASLTLTLGISQCERSFRPSSQTSSKLNSPSEDVHEEDNRQLCGLRSSGDWPALAHLILR